MIVFILAALIVTIVKTASCADVKNVYSVNGILCYECDPGTYWTGDCEVMLTKAKCLPCKSNTFQTTYNRAIYCGPCTECGRVVKNYQEAKVLQTCTADSDAVCGCVEGLHLEKIFGSGTDWMCVENTKCEPGLEVAKPATNNTDTVCNQCKNGFYKQSKSLESCKECSICPNGTFITSACTLTKDTVCSKFKDITRDDGLVLKIVIPIAGGLLIVIIVLGLGLYIRLGCKKENDDSSQHDLTTDGQIFVEPHVNGIVESDDYQSVHSNQEINWSKLFHKYSSEAVIIKHWERFIRTLCINSQKGEKADGIIAEVERAYEQQLVKERIYKALSFWMERCYSSNDKFMYDIFMYSFEHHKHRTKHPNSL